MVAEGGGGWGGVGGRALLFGWCYRFPVVAQLKEGLFGVLADFGGGGGWRPRGAGEVDRRGDHLGGAAFGDGDVDEGAGGVGLRVFDHFVGALDGSPPHAGLVEDGGPLGEGAGGED